MVGEKKIMDDTVTPLVRVGIGVAAVVQQGLAEALVAQLHPLTVQDEAARGVQGVDQVQVVGPGLGPVFPGVGLGIA